MKKVLLFGFETLPEILTVAGIVQQFGGEAVPVAKENCGLTLEALAQGKTGRESGVPIGGKMLVFCGLERELDGLLAALRQAGVVCLKAVLKERSPSCGCGAVYDGTFTGTLTAGDGVTAALLRAHGIRVLGESQVLELLAPDGEKP